MSTLREPLFAIGTFLFLASLCYGTTYECIVANDVSGSPTQLNGINNSNVAVGSYTQNGVTHGFTENINTESITTVDYPGAAQTKLLSINNNGLILGYASNQQGTFGYFTLDSSGNFAGLVNNSSWGVQFAYGINDNGAISVLASQGSNTSTQYSFGILNADGSFTAVPGYPSSVQPGEAPTPGGLNNSSQMLEDGLPNPQAASPGGVIAQIQFQNLSSVLAFGVNNSNVVVAYGTNGIGSNPYANFTVDLNSGTSSEVVCLLPPGEPQLLGVNDNGLLVGTVTASGANEPVIAYPQSGVAQISVSTSSLTFPPTPVGQTSAPMPVTITNTGNARLDMYATGTLRFPSPNFGSPAGIGGFSADSGCFQLSTYPPETFALEYLDPGASCTMNITATPLQQGQQTVTETIHNSTGTQVYLNLSVTGTAAGPPPTCQVSYVGTGQANLTMQDPNSGLASISPYSEANATARIPSVTPGMTSPVTGIATQSDLSLPGEVTLVAKNVAGESTTCSANFGTPGTLQWTGTGGSITGRISVIANSNGTLAAFARGTDSALWTATQTSPDGPWGSWQSLGGVLASDPAVALNGNGVIEVYVLGSDNSLWQISQASPSAPFSGWQGLGGALIGDPAVAVSASSLVSVFATGADHTLWYLPELSPGGPWGSWSSLGGYIISSPAAITNGKMEAFAVGGDNAVWYIQQNFNSGDWGGWSSLGGSIAGNPIALLNGSNFVEVFGRGTDNTIWNATYAGPAGWQAFASLGGYVTSDPSAAFDTSGVLEVFARGGDNALWYTTNTAPGSSAWNNWTSLGGVLANGPTAAINQDGRIAVFVEGSDTTMWTIEQPVAGSWNQQVN